MGKKKNVRIALDETHWLNSDTWSYWITALIEPEQKEGKKKRKPYERRVSGYMPTFESAVESFIDMSVNESTATSLNKLKNDIRKLKAEVRAWEKKNAST